MLVNGDSARAKEIHDRGNNSMKFHRKSLSVELDKAIQLSPTVKLKKFNLISLSMDKNFWHNRWANLLLESQGLFPLFNTYCKVWINDEAQGIYLLVEKPTHYRSTINSPYMLRRGVKHAISDEYFEHEQKDNLKKYRQQYQHIYTTLKARQTEEIESSLNKLINLNMYFRWMAFNYLVMNGDYSDEVYLYIQPNSGLFEVLPWDFDDILKPAPHEGWATRNKELADKKVYSLEETLDREIAANPQLYHAYEIALKSMITQIDSTAVASISKQVLDELKEISSDKEIAESSLFLDRQPFDYSHAQKDIFTSIDLLLIRRKWILTEIK
jgi:spore coat protein H